ncbi:MAG: hypothetical protein HQK59_07390 [Deltaproteobacteria bacterium]|nr:hypothetical protein [Deltaproteobacteria bacterium]
MRLHLTRRFKKVAILFIAVGAVLAAGVAIYQSGLPELGVDWVLEKITHSKISANSHQVSLKWTGLELDAQGVALWLPPDRTTGFSPATSSISISLMILELISMSGRLLPTVACCRLLVACYLLHVTRCMLLVACYSLHVAGSF